ncbi:hypothetical protein CDD83_9712 [Cordyceps sp. RAO-2017]|nr:hypothetical protein CDD83_9712 [Cordyceps sp. RAO-2017]
MLSVDFASPLAGAARTERIKQMTINHAAFAKSRYAQELLVKVQHALRRMPGVCGNEANELVSHLQEVGQIINQETTQLVDALMNITLDQEETEQAIARMSLDANLAQAKTDDQAQTINDLRAEVQSERERRERAEADAERREALGGQLQSLTDRADKQDESISPDDLVQVGESASRRGSPRAGRRPQTLAQTLRDIEKRMHSKPPPAWMYAQHQQRVMEAEHGQEDNQVVQKKLLAEAGRTPPPNNDGDDSLVTPAAGNRQQDMHRGSGPVRVASAFQGMSRTPAPVPPKFGPLSAGPPRAPAAMAHERRFQGSWGGQGRAVSSGGNFMTGSAFSQPVRKGAPGFQPLPRYRPGGGPDYQQAALATPQEGGSLAQRRDLYPSTPTSGGGNRFGRFSDAGPMAPMGVGGVGGGMEPSAMVGRGSLAGPPIHLTERGVAAWNEQIMEFYGAIRHFVGCHAGEPDGSAMLQMGNTNLWPVLLATYHPLSEAEAASYLDYHLRNETSKACVVTRVIVDYVVNRVWVPGAWVGSDSKTTYDLLDLQRELEATQGQASAARQPLLNQQAAIIGSILRNEQGSRAWHRSKVEDVARMLQRTVQPLMNKFVHQHDAHRDLERVAELAWELSSKLLGSRLTFDFRFPDIGARFSAQSMLPIWPPQDPAELQAKHWRVAFVTTPAITARNDTGAGISAHSVALADVFCMQ